MYVKKNFQCGHSMTLWSWQKYYTSNLADTKGAISFFTLKKVITAFILRILRNYFKSSTNFIE